ncbi:hypothetical protein [Citrobacter braakii]|uniref:hypothetical protein n=1 Tax=Citrobacter braakii TaxID=57706 RepID=UPI003D719A07
MANKKSSDMTITEISIVSERLHHLLKTISEGHYEFEDGQRFSLIEIAWELSGEIEKWMNAQEGRDNG